MRIIKGEKYLRAFFKNTIISISHYLKNFKLQQNYNLLNKTNFSKLYTIFNDILKKIKKLEIDTVKPYEGLINKELKIIIYNNAMFLNEFKGLLRRVFFWICLLGYL